MARAKTNHHLYIGRAGHLACMAECLSRGWNVAIPEVDVGEDIFVVEDETSKLAKVQVKTATGKKMNGGFKAQFIIPLKQITDDTTKGGQLRFIFVTRYEKEWQHFLILTRSELELQHLNNHLGTATKNGDVKLTLYYKIENDNSVKIIGGTQKGFSPKPDLSPFKDKWESVGFSIRITEGN